MKTVRFPFFTTPWITKEGGNTMRGQFQPPKSF